MPCYIDAQNYLCTDDGVRICRVMRLPNDYKLVFCDRNRQRSAARGSNQVAVSVMDMVKAVSDKKDGR